MLSLPFSRHPRDTMPLSNPRVHPQVRKALPQYSAEEFKTHFHPRYKPWDQRLCAVADGDLFKVGVAWVCVCAYVWCLSTMGVLLFVGSCAKAAAATSWWS
jgi:hypothetical protein